MKVFSLEKYKGWLKERDIIYYDWAGQHKLEGLTVIELSLKGIFPVSDDWMVEKEK